jgi:hypothetical protein
MNVHCTHAAAVVHEQVPRASPDSARPHSNSWHSQQVRRTAVHTVMHAALQQCVYACTTLIAQQYSTDRSDSEALQCAYCCALYVQTAPDYSYQQYHSAPPPQVRCTTTTMCHNTTNHAYLFSARCFDLSCALRVALQIVLLLLHCSCWFDAISRLSLLTKCSSSSSTSTDNQFNQFLSCMFLLLECMQPPHTSPGSDYGSQYPQYYRSNSSIGYSPQVLLVLYNALCSTLLTIVLLCVAGGCDSVNYV